MPRYQEQEQLGTGASGVVDSVYDRRLQRIVARKSLRSGAPLKGFLREAQLAASLQHPGIVPIYDASEDENGPWYTMRRIQGRSLEDALEDAEGLAGRLRLLPAFERVCEAMAYAHEHGVVHRDLKPANVMLGGFGEVMVVDFGLAVRTGEARPGRIVGTPSFMSPEAARGEAATPAGDVWSLGATLYCLLAGRPPFRGPTRALVERLAKAPPPLPPPPPEAPRELVAIVEKAMRTDPAERYPSAVQLVADVAAFTGGQLVGAHAYTPWELLRHFVRRYRTNLVVLGLVAATLLVVVAGAWWRTGQERDRAVRAELERTNQLARSLEARARSLGDAPAAETVARQALELDPTLPWARGVLAEFHAPLQVEELRTLPLQGCTSVYPSGEQTVLGCGQQLQLLEPDGTVVDQMAWDIGPARYALVRSQGDQLQAVQVIDGELGHSSNPMPVDAGPLRRMLLLPLEDDVLGWWCVLVDDEGRRWSGRCDGTLEAEVQRFEDTLGDYRVAGRPGGPSLLWSHAHVSVCDETLSNCRVLAFPGVVQLALWDRNSERAVIMAASGEAMLYDHPSGTLWPLDRAAAGGVQQLVWVDGLVVALNVRNEVFVYNTDGSEVGRFALGGHGRIRLGAVGRDLWILRDEGVRVVRLHPPEVPPMVRTNNGIGSLLVHGGHVWASVDDQVVWIEGADDVPIARLPDYVKDLAPYGEGVLVATGRRGIHALQPDGTLQQLDEQGARRLAVDGERWLAGHFNAKLQGTDLASYGDLDAQAGRVIHEAAPRTVRVTELSTERVLFEHVADQDVWALAIAPDGSTAVFALADHRVRHVDLATGEVTLLPGAHEAYVAALGYAPSGRRVASGSWDGTSFLWRDGTLEAALEAHMGRVTEVAFADEDRLLTGSWDGTVRRWDLGVW